MKRIIVKDSYSMGKQTGKIFRSYLRRHIKYYESLLKLDDVVNDLKIIKETLLKTFPNQLEEINGRAAGANVSSDALLLLMSKEYLNQLGGCTTVYINEHNHHLLGHNEDGIEYYKDSVAFICYVFDTYEVSGFVCADRLIGNAFCWNSYGLIFTSNYIFEPNINWQAISRYQLLHSIINAKTIEEVNVRLENITIGSAFSLNVYDRNKQIFINFEKGLDQLFMNHPNPHFVHSNHYLAKEKQQFEHSQNSLFRYKKPYNMLTEIEDSFKLNDLRKMLKFRGNSDIEFIFKTRTHGSPGITAATFLYDSHNDEIIIEDHINHKIIVAK